MGKGGAIGLLIRYRVSGFRFQLDGCMDELRLCRSLTIMLSGVPAPQNDSRTEPCI